MQRVKPKPQIKCGKFEQMPFWWRETYRCIDQSMPTFRCIAQSNTFRWLLDLVWKLVYLSTSVICYKPLQTVLTKITPEKMSGQIWIQTVCHSDGIPEGSAGEKKSMKHSTEHLHQRRFRRIYLSIRQSQPLVGQDEHRMQRVKHTYLSVTSD